MVHSTMCRGILYRSRFRSLLMDCHLWRPKNALSFFRRTCSSRQDFQQASAKQRRHLCHTDQAFSVKGQRISTAADWQRERTSGSPELCSRLLIFDAAAQQCPTRRSPFLCKRLRLELGRRRWARMTFASPIGLRLYIQIRISAHLAASIRSKISPHHCSTLCIIQTTVETWILPLHRPLKKRTCPSTHRVTLLPRHF